MEYEFFILFYYFSNLYLSTENVKRTCVSLNHKFLKSLKYFIKYILLFKILLHTPFADYPPTFKYRTVMVQNGAKKYEMVVQWC